MVRTQVQLTEEQASSLRQLARAENVSVAELIRRGVDKVLASSRKATDEERKRRALAMLGSIKSEVDDISIHHDKYLDEAYGS